MADVKPFRALRYDESVAGPLGDARRAAVRRDRRPSSARSYRAAARTTSSSSRFPTPRKRRRATLEEWRAQGVLVDEPPAVWALEQDYVGPDGVARTRVGLVASLEVEPYETGTVLPHERTHAGPKEGRLRLLRATRVQLEPIFLLYDGAAPSSGPTASPGPRGRGREALADRRPVRRPGRSTTSSS